MESYLTTVAFILIAIVAIVVALRGDSQFPSLTVVYADADCCSAGVPPAVRWASRPPPGARRPRASRRDPALRKPIHHRST